MTGLPMQYVRDTTVSKDVHRLLELQKKDWLYFIGKLFKLSEKYDFDLDTWVQTQILEKMICCSISSQIFRPANLFTTISKIR